MVEHTVPMIEGPGDGTPIVLADGRPGEIRHCGHCGGALSVQRPPDQPASSDDYDGFVKAIYLQPPSEGAKECVIIEVIGGPKAYARYWPGDPPPRIEWGWSLHESALKLWPRSEAADG